MSKTGGASLFSALLSAIGTKFLAVYAGPAAVALMSTLQQIRQTALVAATGNSQTALVQGASAFDGEGRLVYVRTAATLFSVATAFVSLTMVVAPQCLLRIGSLSASELVLIRWLAVPLALSSVYVFLSAFINSLGDVGALAALQVVSSLALALGAWPAAHLAATGRFYGLILLMAFSAGIAAASAVCVLLCRHRTAFLALFVAGRSFFALSAARHLLSISLVMLVTGLLASVALLFVRGRIIASQGLAVAGQFDAAWGLSMNQVTLVLSSFQSFYLPALARTQSRAERHAQISAVLTVACLVSSVGIATIALLKPMLLAMFYSPAFVPATHYLRWTLLGDYLKVSSWTLSIPMLAAANMRVFLFTDLLAYGAFIIGADLFAVWLSPAESAGAAFVFMYAIHFIACGAVAWIRHQYRPTLLATAAWMGGCALVGTLSFLTWD
jgi:O-antigen/teichoic acid export membrane protein